MVMMGIPLKEGSLKVMLMDKILHDPMHVTLPRFQPCR